MAGSWLTCCPSGCPGPSPQSYFPAGQSLSCTGCMGLFLPRCRTLRLPLLNFIRLLSTQLSSLSRSRWMAAQPPGVPAIPPSFVPSASLWRLRFVPSSRTLMNKSNKTGSSIGPWCKPALYSGSKFQMAFLRASKHLKCFPSSCYCSALLTASPMSRDVNINAGRKYLIHKFN